MVESTFIARYDAEPEFWQFLNGLTHEDLISELVQNELDAESTRTCIRFESDRFICEGDGQPIDDEGWTRLSFIRGAGKEAPRKRLRIGVKNHGLKTCFTIGNEIVIGSGGKLFKQTLYRNGPDAPPSPATFDQPISDPTAPARGCRIEVPYRTKALATTYGEPLEFAAPDEEIIEGIFHRACAEIPDRFIGVVRPDVRKSYEIQLSHHRLGSVTFLFECAAVRRVRGGHIFKRSCAARGDVSPATAGIREEAFLFGTPVVPSSTHEIPSFYEHKGGFLSEIAWRLDRRGRPSALSGRLRYPIAYPGTAGEARSGLGVHFSGPFISDQERHGVSAASFNPQVTAACDAALIRILPEYLVPKYGARALRLLVDPLRSGGERLRALTAALLEAGGVPLASKPRGRLKFGPRAGADGTIREVVVPVYLWDTANIVRTLAELCPSDCDRVDSTIPTEVIELLADDKFPGWQLTHVTFDEDDAVKRLQPTRSDVYYPWSDDQQWRAELSKPRQVRKYLDVLLALCENEPPTPAETAALRSTIHLPDTRGGVRPMSELYIGNELPNGLAALGAPALLNAELAGHRLFKRRDWRPRRYSFEAFLQKINFLEQPESTRGIFWEWLRKNWGEVPKKSAGSLASLPIWPSRAGSTHTLKELCLPRNAKIADTLSRAVRLPAPGVLGLRAVRRKGRGALVLRSEPTPAELNSYYYANVGRFARDRRLTHDEAANFREFERELSVLAADRQIVAWLARQPAFGLSRDGTVKPVRELHSETEQIASLSLLDADLLDRGNRALEAIFPSRKDPTSAAVIRALEHDAARHTALVPRLKALGAALRREARSDQPVKEIACIPHSGKILAPARLGFRGNRGDYWGEWKVSLPGKGLSADEQVLYKAAGVTSGEPDGETSLAFFEWLNRQTSSVVSRHLEAIIRHFAHPRGVRQWWENHPDVPCLPVQVGPELRLVNRRQAVRKNSSVYLPDFEDLAQAIRDQPRNERLALAIVSRPNVAEPITQFLRDSGVRSLRHKAMAPLSVVGEEPISADSLFETVKHLRSSRMENLRKRLAALELPTSLRPQWRSRLEEVVAVTTAARVYASFRLAGRTYRVQSASGFDQNSGVIWLQRRTEREIEDALFEALMHRVFDEDAPKFAAYVLQKAVRHEFREAEPLFANVSASAADENESSAEDSSEQSQPGETSQTHRPVEPDLSKNLPRPGPIPQNEAAAQQRGIRTGARETRSTGARQRDSVEIENLHRADLKQNQYAWHCQVCLATRSPRELAPEGSYVAFAENRHRLIEAHHADQLHSNGARHAGNLLVLCHHHHHQLGNALSRDLLTSALRACVRAKNVTFFSGDATADRRVVAGQIVSVAPPTLARKVKFFFTTAHREHWLQTSVPASRRGET